MPRIEHIIVGLIVIWVIYAIARHANRTEADKAKPSLAVRAVNAAGGNVEATRTLPAAAELTGRAAAATGRGIAAKTRTVWGAGTTRAREAKAARRETRAAQGERATELSQAAWDGAVHTAAKFVGALNRRRAKRGDTGRIWRWRWSKKNRADDRTDGGTGDAPEARTPEPDASEPERDAPEGQGEQPEQRPSRWRRFFRWGRGRRGDQVNPDSAEAPEDAPDSGDGEAADSGTPITDPAAKAAWQKVAAQTAGYCTEAGCTGRGIYVHVTLDGVRKTPCPNCTTTKEENVTATIDNQPAAATEAAPKPPAPRDWGGVASRVAAFEPESDADLINFMSAEILGMCGYSDAYEALHETCTRSLGLDQRSVQGLGEFGERVVDLTREMALAHKRFVVIYQEVMRMVADGTVMPHNGRFFSGEVQV